MCPLLTGPGNCPLVSEISSEITCEPGVHCLPHILSPPVLIYPTLPLSAQAPLRLTCPWCSLSCSCTRSRGAGRGSSESHCSHGARLHIHPPGGRTGRPRMPQDVRMLALTPEDTASPRASLHHLPQTPGPFSTPESHLRITPVCSPCPSPISLPNSQTLLTISGTTEATFHAVATSILATPGTPATVRSSQAQGTLRSLSTAQ